MTPGSPLDAVMEGLKTPPPELPRLTTLNTFNAYNKMHLALRGAMENCERVPMATNDLNGVLKAVIAFCDAAAKHAAKLLEGNR